jgi:hypothetical protein
MFRIVAACLLSYLGHIDVVPPSPSGYRPLATCRVASAHRPCGVGQVGGRGQQALAEVVSSAIAAPDARASPAR